MVGLREENRGRTGLSKGTGDHFPESRLLAKAQNVFTIERSSPLRYASSMKVGVCACEGRVFVCSPLAGDHRDGDEDHEGAGEGEPQRARRDAGERSRRHLRLTVPGPCPACQTPGDLATVCSVEHTVGRPTALTSDALSEGLKPDINRNLKLLDLV